MNNDIFLKEMGAKIKALRKQNKMTLQQLADLSSVNLSNLWFLEQGRRDAHILTIKAIAEVLNVNVKYFIP